MTFIRVVLTGALLLALGLDLRADESPSGGANRPSGRQSGLSSAPAKAPALRPEAVTRETTRETDKQVTQSVIDNETRSAIGVRYTF